MLLSLSCPLFVLILGESSSSYESETAAFSTCTVSYGFPTSMDKERYSSKPVFYGYPEVREALSPFTHTPGSNPVVRGIPLAIAGYACVIFIPDVTLC